jgi:SAM-dependent methyltransferase
MDRSFLARILGPTGPILHGDTLMLDRWRWLKQRLPRTRNGEKLLDVGCGTGAFSIAAASRGYQTLGLSWDERNQRVARERAALCRTSGTAFDVLDVRQLGIRQDLVGQFDLAICLETIEHILDDRKLLQEIFACLKPGGRLLLTTPYYHYRAITPEDDGPFVTEETGWHVRRGYSPAMLEELCSSAGFECEEVSYCSGFFSQKTTNLYRRLLKFSLPVAWGLSFPLRILPLAFDHTLSPALGWPPYSICLQAYKPRFALPDNNRQPSSGQTTSPRSVSSDSVPAFE